MNKLFSLTALAFVCCIALATANMYQMYMPQKGMMYGGGYGGYGYGGGGGAGFNPVGQGGIMQFFFMSKYRSRARIQKVLSEVVQL